MIMPLLLVIAASSTTASCPPPTNGMVSLATSFGGVVAPDAAAAKEAMEGGRLAQLAARRRLGVDPEPFLLLLTADRSGPTKPSGCAFVFEWPVGGASTRPPTHVLPHELGHAIFIRYLAPKTRDDQYGGGAPDWLDEMAALAFEDEAGTVLRRADARRLAARHELIPLARLLRMEHPEWAARKSREVAAAQLSHPASSDTPAYYATVRTLLDLLLRRTGDDQVVRKLADEYRGGHSIKRWMLEHASEGGRNTLADLDKAIQAFATTDADYVTAAGADPSWRE